MLRKSRWWWRIVLATACVAAAGLLLILAYPRYWRDFGVSVGRYHVSAYSGWFFIARIPEHPDQPALARQIKAKRDEIRARRKRQLAVNSMPHRRGVLMAELELEVLQHIFRDHEVVWVHGQHQCGFILFWESIVQRKKSGMFISPVQTRIVAPGERFTAIRAWIPVFVLALGMIPAVQAIVRAARRRRRRAQNCCVCCGYPLQGLLEPRCPECGHLAESRSPTTP